MEQSRFYRKVMLDAFAGLSAEKSKYAKQRARNLPTLYIVVAGDRGLAGGYNNNIFRSAATMIRENDLVMPVGKRSVDYYRHHGAIIADAFPSAENFTSAEGARAAYRIKNLYDEEKIGSVILISTKFNSMLSQTPQMTYLLPLEVLAEKQAEQVGTTAETETSGALIEYEPSAEEVLDALIPEYLAGVLFTSVCEAYASELAARRSAMDTATKNADEMLDSLNLTYNRARQGAITQEITEIVAGANA